MCDYLEANDQNFYYKIHENSLNNGKSTFITNVCIIRYSLFSVRCNQEICCKFILSVSLLCYVSLPPFSHFILLLR